MCSRAYWTLKTADQWLSLRLDFIGSCLILLTAMLAISERNHISPSIAALSLSQVGLFGSLSGQHHLQGSARLVAGLASAGLVTTLLLASCCDTVIVCRAEFGHARQDCKRQLPYSVQ